MQRSGSRDRGAEMNRKSRKANQKLTLNLGTGRDSPDGAGARENRHATLETSSPSTTPGSFWQMIQRSNKKKKSVSTLSTRSMDVSPTTSERTPYPVEDAPSKSSVCSSPEMQRKLAKEAASIVMTKTLAQTAKTGSSLHNVYDSGISSRPRAYVH